MLEIIHENAIPLLDSAAEELLNANVLHEKPFLPSLCIKIMLFSCFGLHCASFWGNMSCVSKLMPSLSKHERIFKKNAQRGDSS